MTITLRLKIPKKAGEPVFKKEIIDIEKVYFKDDFYTVKFEKTDQIIWLFRKNWRFGLYFDLTRNCSTEELPSILGNCYKYLEYYDIYSILRIKITTKKLWMTAGFHSFSYWIANLTRL